MFQRYVISPAASALLVGGFFICDGLAHTVSIPNGFAQRLLSAVASAYAVAIPDGSTHWLLSAMAFITHTVFYESPSRFIRDGM
jgi:hypothetical protein